MLKYRAQRIPYLDYLAASGSPYLDYLATYYRVPRLLKLGCMTSDGLFDCDPPRVLNTVLLQTRSTKECRQMPASADIPPAPVRAYAES
jgi:hypothetical protein